MPQKGQDLSTSKSVKKVGDYKYDYNDQYNDAGKKLSGDEKTAQTVVNRLSRNAQYKSAGQAVPKSYSKGGKVKKTGMAKVHKGERVLTMKQSKKFSR